MPTLERKRERTTKYVRRFERTNVKRRVQLLQKILQFTRSPSVEVEFLLGVTEWAPVTERGLKLFAGEPNTLRGFPSKAGWNWGDLRRCWWNNNTGPPPPPSPPPSAPPPPPILWIGAQSTPLFCEQQSHIGSPLGNFMILSAAERTTQWVLWTIITWTENSLESVVLFCSEWAPRQPQDDFQVSERVKVGVAQVVCSSSHCLGKKQERHRSG